MALSCFSSSRYYRTRTVEQRIRTCGACGPQLGSIQRQYRPRWRMAPKADPFAIRETSDKKLTLQAKE
jgi:hypothetical protein